MTRSEVFDDRARSLDVIAPLAVIALFWAT
jgi:hypothetical protein